MYTKDQIKDLVEQATGRTVSSIESCTLTSGQLNSLTGVGTDTTPQTVYFGDLEGNWGDGSLAFNTEIYMQFLAPKTNEQVSPLGGSQLGTSRGVLNYNKWSNLMFTEMSPDGGNDGEIKITFSGYKLICEAPAP